MTEPGISMALGSIADHWEAMNDMQIKLSANGSAFEETSTTNNTMFEYWLLLFGLIFASFVFAGELIAGRTIYGRFGICSKVGRKNYYG